MFFDVLARSKIYPLEYAIQGLSACKRFTNGGGSMHNGIQEACQQMIMHPNCHIRVKFSSNLGAAQRSNVWVFLWLYSAPLSYVEMNVISMQLTSR